MTDPAYVDAAVVARLKSDSALAGLMPDGVFFDVAASGAKRFVVVSLASHVDDYVFEGSAFELTTYLIKAVALATSGADVNAAAARIHTLLQDAPLTISGYTHGLTRRAERVRYTEIDDVNHDIRWQHRGGRYDVFVSPA